MKLFDVDDGEEIIPVSLKDRLDHNDAKRKLAGDLDDDGEEMTWVFEDELG